MKHIYMLTTLQALVDTKIKKPEEINELVKGYQLRSVGETQYFVK